MRRREPHVKAPQLLQKLPVRLWHRRPVGERSERQARVQIQLLRSGRKKGMTEQPPAASLPTASLALAGQLPPTAPEWIIYASTMLDSKLFSDRWAELVTLVLPSLWDSFYLFRSRPTFGDHI